jgi:hypothetical protein
MALNVLITITLIHVIVHLDSLGTNVKLWTTVHLFPVKMEQRVSLRLQIICVTVLLNIVDPIVKTMMIVWMSPAKMVVDALMERIRSHVIVRWDFSDLIVTSKIIVAQTLVKTKDAA